MRSAHLRPPMTRIVTRGAEYQAVHRLKNTVKAKPVPAAEAPKTSRTVGSLSWIRRRGLSLYAFSSRVLPTSYVSKLLLVTFIGVYFPMLVILFNHYYAQRNGAAGNTTFLIAIAAVFAGSGMTMYLVYGLMAPLYVTAESLRRYIEDRQLPDLPTEFMDAAGQLMADTQRSLNQLDQLMNLLEQQALIDELTGLYNRRASQFRLAEEVTRSKRGPSTMSVAIVDLDYFKLVNDRHGHSAGDSCLKEFAELIRSNLRQSDWVGRWGGDEFIVVLWDTDEGASRLVFERILASVKSRRVSLSTGVELSLSMTAGITSYQDDDTPLAILGRADQALYHGKELGRGRVVCDTQDGWKVLGASSS